MDAVIKELEQLLIFAKQAMTAADAEGKKELSSYHYGRTVAYSAAISIVKKSS